MSTFVWVHAHPDDEAILTGGAMMRAAADGHRNVLVVATNGEYGEVPDDLAAGETLADRRRIETEASAAVLGLHRIVWLGYRDSGMTGWEQNANPDSFHQADLEGAAATLAAVLKEEEADVLVAYDWHGAYGHPDHIKVHHVGLRAAALAGTPRVFEATINRDALQRFTEMVRESDADGEDLAADEFDPTGPMDDGNPMGEPAAVITHEVDVGAYAARKRTAVACHHSQVTDTSFFLRIPEAAFREAFGTEWYIQQGIPAGIQNRWLLDPV